MYKFLCKGDLCVAYTHELPTRTLYSCVLVLEQDRLKYVVGKIYRYAAVEAKPQV